MPEIPLVPGTGPVPMLHDTATGELRSASSHGVASLYVCGITPYDATHIGHAATYLAFDTLVRAWLDAGVGVEYVQNTTDVDDPLLERATATGVDWRELAASQTDLFRSDMTALGIRPPDHYVAVTDVITEISNAVETLVSHGTAYEVATDDSVDGNNDLYFDSARAAETGPWHLGLESGLDRDTMLALSRQRGGDPGRPGKRDPLDPLLWRAARVGEPAWESRVGRGRPGWHIECSVIAINRLASPITVQAGGSDLIFPHHEFSAGHASSITGEPFADIYAHAGMVAYQGEKMSKSLGNLVLVSQLTARGVDPRSIRLALLDHHYRTDWEWTADTLVSATARLERWTAWAAASTGSTEVDAAAPATAGSDAPDPVVDALRTAVADDLDTPAALAVVDAAIAAACPATAAAVTAIDALLGIRLR